MQPRSGSEAYQAPYHPSELDISEVLRASAAFILMCLIRTSSPLASRLSSCILRVYVQCGFAFQHGLQLSELKASGWSAVTRQPRGPPESMPLKLGRLETEESYACVMCVSARWKPRSVPWKLAPVQALSCAASPHLTSGSFTSRAAVRGDLMHLLPDRLG